MALGLAALTSCGGGGKPSSATEGSFTMVCDDSFENIMEQEIDVFEFDYPKVKVLQRYAPYNETLDSLMSLNTKTVVLPRDLTEAELQSLRNRDRNPRSRRIAVDAVALIVNPENPVDALSTREISAILSGEVSTWYDLDPNLPNDTIRVLFDNAGSSMVKYMSDSLNGGRPLGSNAYAQGSVQGVVDGVRQYSNAIGVLGVSWLTTDLRAAATQSADSLSADLHSANVADMGEINTRTRNSGVKVLGVRTPTEAHPYKPFQDEIYRGLYPLTRSIYLVTTAYSNSPAGGFYSFVTGEIGQKLLQKTGVMPAVYRTQVVELN